MSPPLLHLQDIHLTFGGAGLLDGAELALGAGGRLCLIGRNGSGKSTLLKIASGQVEPDKGTVFLQPGTTVRYLPQEPDLSGFKTVLEYVEDGLAPGDDPHRAVYLLGQLGVSPDLDPSTLSGGEARRAALARVLAPEPDILLLDEPTNHLDLPAIEWLERELASLRSALILISHDRRFLSTLSSSTVWLDRGRTRQIDRGFSHFESWRDKVLEEEEVEAHKLGRKIAMEEHWLRYGVTARRKRNVRRLGNLQSLRAERAERISSNARARETVTMVAAKGDVSGKLVAELKDVSKSYGANSIVKEFSFKLNRGDRVGIVGPNGAGKTTLIKMIMGALEPDSGTIRLGTKLQALTLDQRRESLDPETTLKDALTGGGRDMLHVGGQQRHVIAYMKDFLFIPEQARTPVSRLSGGERGRLMLARALARPSNLMVLDEPTNDLDLETLDLLQEMLSDYDGTLILVSHDRDFLDRVVASTVASEGDGHWQEYAGGYSDILIQRKGVKKAAVAEAKKGAKLGKPPTLAPTQQKRKLTFKDKHALETLPREMERLQSEIDAHKSTLADAELFTRDHEHFQKTVDALSAAETALAEAEERWLELEMLREEMEACS
ncbi:MAG: ATP-binding cassette domain-containing protein [Alphaproteobacteria bacterium]|nr:ATP-binding cassette domain-containing protein [Alphaproteobacteria bacterium]